MRNFFQIFSDTSIEYCEFFGEMILIMFFLLSAIYAYAVINIRYLVNVKKKIKVFRNLVKLISFGIFPIIFMVSFVCLFFGGPFPRPPTNETMLELGALQQVTRYLYLEKKDYSGLSNKLITDSQQIPKRYSKENQLISPFGNIDIFPSKQKTEFVIVFSDIPSNPCEKIANTDFGSGLVNFSINDKNVSDSVHNSPVELHGLCQNKKNKLSFVFS
jgi:hypothetical protein